MIKNKTDRLYDIVWIVNGKDKEVLGYSMPIALARGLAKRYSITTHKSGKVIAREQN